MLPRLYDAKLDISSYNNNGYGFFRDCLKCEVTEERNGAYTLNMTIAKTDALANKVAISMIVKAKANNDDPPQLFEINKLVVTGNGEIEVQAQHIKFLAMQNCISSEGNTVDFSILGTPQNIADFIFDELMFDNLFSFSSDITTEKDFDLSGISSKKLGDVFGGGEYSFLSEFGGEFHYNNFEIELLQNRGTDSGYKLLFGYNMSDYAQTVTNDSAYSHILGYAKVTRSDVDGGSIVLAGKPVTSNSARVFPKVKIIDFSTKIRDYFGGDWKVNPKTGLHYQDTLDMITFFTNEYMTDYKTVEEVNITINYNSELDKMQHLKLCDTVKVCFGKNKLSLTAKISKVVYDSLAERYTLIEVGEQKPSFLDFISKKRR